MGSSTEELRPENGVGETWGHAFTMSEWDEIFRAAAERGVHPLQLVRTAVLEDLYR